MQKFIKFVCVLKQWGGLNQSLVRRLSIAHHSKTALIKQKGDNELTVAIKTIKS